MHAKKEKNENNNYTLKAIGVISHANLKVGDHGKGRVRRSSNILIAGGKNPYCFQKGAPVPPDAACLKDVIP